MPDGSESAIKQGRKFEQVLAGARTIFMRDGFEGAAVDAIAREAGVSKATLYAYFPDKRLLFMEVARRECEQQAQKAMSRIDPAGPIAETLHRVGHEFAAFVTSEFGQRIFRICVAEAERFPELARAFYASGPGLVRSRIRELLAAEVARGALVIDDLDLAADQFPELCKADLFPRMLFQRQTQFSHADIDRVIRSAVAMFMARYGA